MKTAKVAYITGGAQGIGRGISDYLLEDVPVSELLFNPGIERLVVIVRERLPEVRERLRSKLQERVEAIAATVDEERLEQEFALLIQKEMVSGIDRRFARALSQALTPSISCLLIAFIWIIAIRLQEVAP